MSVYDTTHLIMLIKQAQKAARETFQIVLSLPDLDNEEKSCYFSLRMEKTNSFLISCHPLGEINRPDYKRIVQDQVNRLLEMSVSKGHVSGYQSMDLNSSQFAGAILGKDHYHIHFAYSCYGFKNWKIAESISLITAIKVDHLSIEHAARIAKISDNEIFIKSLEQMTAKSKPNR